MSELIYKSFYMHFVKEPEQPDLTLKLDLLEQVGLDNLLQSFPA